MMSRIENPQGLGAYDFLRQEILHGGLMPGERLRVAELNDRFKLGLTPIREALMRLTSEKLVDSQSHRGAQVRETSLTELHDIMETRRQIESLCLAAAIAKGDAVWEADIIRSFHLLSRATLPSSFDDRDTATSWEQYHRQFHFALVSACGSQWLLQFWNMLADHSERYRKLRLLFHRSEEAAVRNVILEHEQIMEAVVGRNTHEAVSLMNGHLTQSEEAVARLIKISKEPKQGNIQ